MTQLQRTFKKSYLLDLKDSVKKGSAVSLYGKPTFDIDMTMTMTTRLANVYEPDGLAERLDPRDDFRSAVALYEAYNNIPPLLATSKEFWAYLTHTSLFIILRSVGVTSPCRQQCLRASSATGSSAGKASYATPQRLSGRASI